MSRLFFLSDIYTVDHVDKLKELIDYRSEYEKVVDVFNVKNGDFVQLTDEYNKSRMIYNGKKFKFLPPDEDFLLIDKFPLKYFYEFSDTVPFDPRGKNLEIIYGNGYAVATNDDVKILYVLRNQKEIDFNDMDIYYSYGEDFIYEDIPGLDLNELLEKDWLFKIV